MSPRLRRSSDPHKPSELQLGPDASCAGLVIPLGVRGPMLCLAFHSGLDLIPCQALGPFSLARTLRTAGIAVPFPPVLQQVCNLDTTMLGSFQPSQVCASTLVSSRCLTLECPLECSVLYRLPLVPEASLTESYFFQLRLGLTFSSTSLPFHVSELPGCLAAEPT